MQATENRPATSSATTVSAPEEKTKVSGPGRMQLDEQTWVEVVDSGEALECYRADWAALAREAICPNSFYESWFLLPALQHLPESHRIQFVLVYRKNKRVTDPDILCGFFPLEAARLKFYPGTVWRLQRNIYQYFCVPLVHQEFARETLIAFFQWAKQARLNLIEFSRIVAEGPFQHALLETLNGTEQTWSLAESTTRAILHRQNELDDYFALRGHYRRDMRRRRRRLEDLGQVEFRVLEDARQLSFWQNSFLDLEEKSWKGSEGTAISQNETHEQFFRDLTTTGFELGQVQFLGLFLNNEPIAIKCNLCSGKGSFAWRIAFDEQYSKYSPGVLLEIDNIEYFHEQTSLEWMDSCAITAHPMINRLWTQRVALQSISIPTSGVVSELYCSVRPLLRMGKRRLRRFRSGKS